MKSVTELLQFNFSPTTFKQSANKAIPVTLALQLGNRVSRLKAITEKIGESSFAFDDESLKSKTYQKFKLTFSGISTSFNKREIRALIYGLDYYENNETTIFSSEKEIAYAVTLINSNWRDSFLKGLSLFLFKNWDSNFQASIEILREFISQKIGSYNGNNSGLLALVKSKQFYSTKNGDVILGDTLVKLNKTIEDASKTLGVPDSWISFPYFSRAIVTYYEKSKNTIADRIDNLIETLLKHNSSITNKRLLSKIIIQANQPQFAILQDKVKPIAFAHIGDPSNISKWSAFENATDIEKSELIQARNILDEWIAKQFIDIFFRVCLNDERRKRFWLKIASKNKVSFKVYGPARTKRILQQDDRIKEYLDARFDTVFSTKDVSAFILYIGDYMLIEFSDAGYAFYAYKTQGTSKPNLNNRLNSVDDLRNGAMPMLVYRTGYSINSTNNEGRLTHNDGDLGWEQVFEYWFKNIAGINV